MVENNSARPGPDPGAMANAAVYAVFSAYALWFLITCGHLLNYEYIFRGARAFTAAREPWMVVSYFTAIAYMAWLAMNFFLARPAANQPLFLIFLAAAALRLIPAMITFGAVSDMTTYELVQRSVLAGRWQDFVPNAPYFPFYSYILHLQGLTNRFLGLPDYFFIKLVPVLFDSAMIFLIYFLTGRRDYAQKYAWNPLTVMICAVHGQFDSITMFFLLLSLYAYGKKNAAASGFSFGAAFQSKWWPVMLAPAFILRYKPKQAVLFMTAWLAVFLVFTFPGHEHNGLKPFLHHGVPFDYGLTGIIHYITIKLMHQKPAVFDAAVYIVMAASFASVSWALFASRKWEISPALFFVILTFYIICPGWSVQYFAWLAAFFFLFGLHKSPIYAAITALVFFIYFLLVVYDLPAFAGMGHSDIWNILTFASLFITLAAVPLWFSMLKNRGKIP